MLQYAPDKKSGRQRCAPALHDFEGDQTYTESAANDFALNATFARDEILPIRRALHSRRAGTRISSMNPAGAQGGEALRRHQQAIAAVCHGPQLLTAAGVVKGRRLNAHYPAVGRKVTAAGGEFVSVRDCLRTTDTHLVTGPAWTCHVEWLKQFLTMLGTKSRKEAAVGARG